MRKQTSTWLLGLYKPKYNASTHRFSCYDSYTKTIHPPGTDLRCSLRIPCNLWNKFIVIKNNYVKKSVLDQAQGESRSKIVLSKHKLAVSWEISHNRTQAAAKADHWSYEFIDSSWSEKVWGFFLQNLLEISFLSSIVKPLRLGGLQRGT